MDKIINVKPETHALLRKYTELRNSQDNKFKNYETRLLELLSRDINISEYKKTEIEKWLKTHEILENRYPISLLTTFPLNVRNITLKYLCIYAYLNEFFSLDEAICDLLEKETCKKEMSKKELEKETRLTNVVGALYQQFQKRTEKMEEEH